MNVDPTGHFIISLLVGVIIVGAIVATVNDIYQIASGNVYVDMNKTNSDNVNIYDSYKILTPWVRYGYSFYLNHFNPDTKNIIQGSTAGMQIEWELHNYAAWFGIGGDSAKHLDSGKSIFSDSKYHPLKNERGEVTATGLMSIAMKVVYIMSSNPIYWIWDLIVNGGF